MTSVCLTGIVRLVESIRLDIQDLPFSNSGPAIWNMVESQVGFVAANIPSKGPLFGKVTATARRLRDTYGSKNLEDGTHGSGKLSTVHRNSFKGFERMADDDRIGVESTVQPGSPPGNSLYAADIPMSKIVVKTNLEQSYENQMPCVD